MALEALRITLAATNPGALVGQVVRNGREPVADSAVLLVPDYRRRNELYQTTTTDASGRRFHFEKVPPRNYKVFSWEEVEDGAWYDAEFMKGIENHGVPVDIREGLSATTRIDVIP